MQTWFNDKRRFLTQLVLLTGIIGLVLVAALFAYGANLAPTRGLYVPAARYVTPEQDSPANHLGSFAKWTKVEVSLQGPQTSVSDGSSNPFQVRVDVTFTGPDDQSFTVPAFYDGDGQGGNAGNVWKVRFAPNTSGRWRFESASSEPLLAGYKGTFDVTAPQECSSYEPGGLPDLACVGRLQYEEGQHYLKFVDGGYWIKGGIDDPENFIGAAFGGWQEKREAVDFLAEHGTNSIYVITNNITPGDRNDTWPWLGETSEEAKRQSDRFDVVRLQAWESFFEYVQQQGITLHIILDDDSAWHAYDHYLYYREMVARFGHHAAIIWNIGEEANEIYRDSEQIRLAELLRELDPYDHPVTVHRKPPWPFLGEAAFDLTSIQPGDGAGDFDAVNNRDFNEIVGEHRSGSMEAGRPIPIMVDETPRVTRVNEDTRFMMRSRILYPIYLAGGQYEMHYYDAYGQGGTLTIEQMGPMLQDMQYARRFMEGLPFHEMEPCNDLLFDRDEAYCLGKTGDVYAVYSATGAPFAIDLSAMDGEFWLQWFDPQQRTMTEPVPINGGARRELRPPRGQEAAAVLSRDEL
jgi:hypothetical protein